MNVEKPKKQLVALEEELTPLEKTDEGKLRGGFSAKGISDFALYSSKDNGICNGNGTCKDNGTCVGNGKCTSNGVCSSSPSPTLAMAFEL